MDREPRVFREVREIINALPQDQWLGEDKAITVVPDSLVGRGKSENTPTFAKLAYPAYTFLLKQNSNEVWSIDKIYERSSQAIYNKDESSRLLLSAVILLVCDLDRRDLLEFADDGSIVDRETEFYLRGDLESQVHMYEYCADLGDAAGAGLDEINSYRQDAQVLRKQSDLLWE